MKSVTAATAFVLVTAAAAGAAAQDLRQANGATAAATAGAVLPRGYVIGTDDVLSVLFWREKDMSADVTVRPYGKVTLPLLNDVQAAGLTPEEFRGRVVEAARRFVESPNATVIVKEIKSRKVFITGRVDKPGPYPLTENMTVLQLIAVAGGLRDFADGDNISVLRDENGRQVVFEFNYQDVLRRKKLQQNIPLKPGDTVVVP
jgi:polysaccharide export outer membrane protein